MRSAIKTAVGVVALIALALVLYNATLVDRLPPTVTRISLSASAAGDEHLAQTLTAIDIEFSEPVDRGSAERSFRIAPYVRGTFNWDRATVLIFTPASKLPLDTGFSVSLAAGFADLAGNPAPNPAGPFAFHTVGPPTVIAVVPADGTTGVATDTSVTLTFDRLMDTAAVGSALRVQPASPYRATWSGPSLTLAFDTPLAYGTTYVIQVGRAAADTDGSLLATAFQTSFTTVGAGLGVRVVVPADGVSGISVQSPIAVIFDGPVDPTSIQGALRISPPVAGDIQVTELPTDVPSAGQTPAPGSLRPANGTPAGSPSGLPAASPAVVTSHVLVINPSSPLRAHTTYTVELLPIVRRADDPGQVAAGRTWTFTTGGPSTAAQNQIAFLSARSGIRNVWLMNPDGSNPRQITTDLAPVREYDVTPDGRTIVYEAAGAVQQMRVDGSSLTTLTLSGVHEYAPVLTPDGTAVLVARRDQAGADLGYWLEPLAGTSDAPPSRQVLGSGAPVSGSAGPAGSVVGAGPGVSAWAGMAAFDPTGRYVVLVAGADRRAVRLDLGPSAAVVQVTDLGLQTDLGPPVWDDATGAFLLVAGGAQGQGLMRIPSDGAPTILFPAAGPVAVAGHGGIVTLVAPGGSHIGYSALLSAAPEPLTTDASLLDRTPSFSPDGTTLVFVRVRAADPTGSAGIWLCSLTGRDLRQLASDGTDARWLP